MSGIEDYGGQCPLCKNPMLMKWESCRLGFLFDACPWCGFAYGTDSDGEYSSKEVWRAIFAAHKVKSLEELIKKLKLTKDGNGGAGSISPSIFDYSKDSKEELKKRITE